MNPTLLDCCRQNADEFRNSPRAGPYWAIKHQYAVLYDEVVCLQKQLEQKSVETAEGIPMVITITLEELYKILEAYLNQKVLREPIEIEYLVPTDDEARPLSDNNWDKLEITCRPKDEKQA